jgi:hypothetical protein
MNGSCDEYTPPYRKFRMTGVLLPYICSPWILLQRLKANYREDGGVISPEVYGKANVTTVEECIEAVKRVGLPVMIKVGTMLSYHFRGCI